MEKAISNQEQNKYKSTKHELKQRDEPNIRPGHAYVYRGSHASVATYGDLLHTGITGPGPRAALDLEFFS